MIRWEVIHADPRQLNEIEIMAKSLYPHVGMSVPISFVVFLYMGKEMFTPSTLHHALSIIYVGAVLHFSAVYCVSLSIAIWSKQHCVSCVGTGAWLFRCSLYRRPSQSERPARAGLSCEC